MSNPARLARDPIDDALAWASSHGIRVAPWPPPGPTGADPLPLDPTSDPPEAVLYLVAADAHPPVGWSELEDWVRLPAAPDEVFRRAERLLMRAAQAGARATSVDDDGLLQVGERRVVLSTIEARLMRLLLAHAGQLVTREEAVEVMWPDGPPQDPRALDNRLKSLRRRIETSSLRVHTIRTRGLLLEWRGPA